MARTANKTILACAILGFILLFFSSCGATRWQQINYIQDVRQDSVYNAKLSKGFLIQPHDKIIIIVSSRNNAVAAQFNKPVFTTFVGTETEAIGGQATRTTVYTVDNNGCINFPVYGMVKVSGMNRWEVQEMLEGMLKEDGMLVDANVTVLFHNITYSVMGEVENPGTFYTSGDKVTVFQALATAGDLTIFGRRDNVKVIREVDGERQVYVMDLRDSDVFDSPAYYLLQNDVVYVTPNNTKASQSTANENKYRYNSLFLQMGTLAISAISLIATVILNSK